MRFESVSGQVYKGSRTRDKTESELRKLSVQSKCSWQKRLRKNVSIIISLCQKSLNLLWKYSDSEPQLEEEKQCDLIGRGICHIVVDLYVKAGQRPGGKYWFLGRFMWYVYPLFKTRSQTWLFLQQDSKEKKWRISYWSNKTSDLETSSWGHYDDDELAYVSMLTH